MGNIIASGYEGKHLEGWFCPLHGRFWSGSFVEEIGGWDDV